MQSFQTPDPPDGSIRQDDPELDLSGFLGLDNPLLVFLEFPAVIRVDDAPEEVAAGAFACHADQRPVRLARYAVQHDFGIDRRGVGVDRIDLAIDLRNVILARQQRGVEIGRHRG